VATLSQQQQAAQTHIQQLTDANRKLSDELSALGERLSDADTVQRVAGTARLLH
jgi:regulator of replication initiation timing